MARKRMFSVSPRTGTSKSKSTHCGTITKADILRMDRAARREAEIASGINSSSGTGAHGGSKPQQRRKARRQAKDELRRSTDW